MLKSIDFYYFSPTGGTKKAGSALSFAVAESVHEVNLAEGDIPDPNSDIIVVAAPVFAGRIPVFVSDKLALLDGKGRKAITAVVYGVRAYDDALLELNDILKARGFEVIASAALIAQHSIVSAVGAGRPDEADMEDIRRFAKQILKTIENGETGTVNVPGNRPYRDGMKGSIPPLSLPACNGCGHCATICPTRAITVTGDGVVTDTDPCMMCMACVAGRPTGARILPPPHLERLTQMLSAFKDLRKENEFYLLG